MSKDESAAGSAPTVSVLIAAYNAAGFIDRAIASAVAQAPAPLEVLVVDDRSTDDTVAVVKRLAAAEPRIRLLELAENLGPAGARNAGLDAARGDWIAVLDADDAYLPGRLAALLETAAATGADVVADNFRYYDSIKGEVGEPALATTPATEPIVSHVYVARARAFGDEADWGMLKPMLRRGFLDAHRLRYPAYSRHGEDFLFMMDILLTGGVCVLNRAPYYLYSTRESGNSRTRVDYVAMRRHSSRLLHDPRVARDPSLRRAVKGRVKSVKRLGAERRLVELIVARDAIGVAWAAIRDPYAARLLLRLVAKRLNPARR